jgi:hypothetical protein
VTGDTTSPDFPLAGPIDSTFGSPAEAFIVKLSADGSILIYSTYLGGSGGDEGHGIAVDEAGQAYVTGSTISFNFPLVNPLDSIIGGGGEGFVAKLVTDWLYTADTARRERSRLWHRGPRRSRWVDDP